MKGFIYVLLTLLCSILGAAAMVAILNGQDTWNMVLLSITGPFFAGIFLALCLENMKGEK